MEPPQPSSAFTLVATAAESGAASSDSPENLLLNLLIVFLLVLANGFFVAAEFALVGVRKTRIDHLASEGSTSAKLVQGALKDLDRYIAATQVGITIASLLLGGIGERTFHHLFEPLFEALPFDLPASVSSGALAFGMAYFVMTALHVVIGELMPKSISLQFAERTTLVVARPLIGFAWLVAPLIWILNGTGNFLLRRMGIHPVEGHAQVHSPEELDLLVSQSHEGGELNDTEAEILHRVVRFSELTTREIMVPRTEMQALPLELPKLALRAWIHSRPHSRVPVYHETHDEVIGIVHLKDLVPFAAKVTNGHQGNNSEADDEAKVSLLPLVRETLRVPETMTVDRLLVEFKKARQQMAIVIDEYGGTAGIVTVGDLLEQVFGEVADEFDVEDEEIRTGENGVISLAGRTLIEDVNERFNTDFEMEDADTIAGLVINELGRPGKVGDEVEINGAKLRVEEVERLRIMRLSLVLPVTEEENAESPTPVTPTP